jgi:MFS family permease
MIFAVGGVTSLLGALAAGWLTRRAGIGPAMILGHLFTGLGSLFLIAAGDTSALAVVLLVANQCVTDPAATVADIASTSLRQSVAPAHAIGRVNAGIRFIGLLMTLVFTLLAGLLAGAIGLRGVMAIGVALNFLPALWLLLSPVRGMHAVMDGEDQPAAVSAPAGEGIPRA